MAVSEANCLYPGSLINIFFDQYLFLIMIRRREAKGFFCLTIKLILFNLYFKSNELIH